MNFEWTTEKPTVPGWYWVREEEDENYMVNLPHHMMGYSMPRYARKWTGPMPEPKEPQQ